MAGVLRAPAGVRQLLEAVMSYSYCKVLVPGQRVRHNPSTFVYGQAFPAGNSP
jgi:hypothetical protein